MVNHLVGQGDAAAAARSAVFFTFSTFTMQGLNQLPAAQGIAAMQSINVAALRPALMTVMFGTAMVSAGLVARACASSAAF